MARIYDNINDKFTEGLKGIVAASGVKRVDFCVGYFNLRGWKMIVDQIDTLPGDDICENEGGGIPYLSIAHRHASTTGRVSS